MPQTLALIDYGSGNLRSAEKALQRAARETESDIAVVLTDDPEAVRAADRVVLPGVGAFGDCLAGIQAVAGLKEALFEAAVERARPFLGICVGMQLMAERGLEHGRHPGFGWIGGEVTALQPSDPSLKIPHMGWNALEALVQHPLLEGLAPGQQVYFVHSFHLAATQPAQVLAQADHGGRFAAMVGRDNLAGTQFHPEKSQAVGLRLLGNFLRWKP